MSLHIHQPRGCSASGRFQREAQSPATILLVQNAATVVWEHLGVMSLVPGPSLLAGGSSGSGSFSVAEASQGVCAAPAVLGWQAEVWVWIWQGQGVSGQSDRSSGDAVTHFYDVITFMICCCLQH